MKLCGVVAIAVLVVVLCSQAQSQIAEPDECCFKFYSKLIPGKQIKEYRLTHPSCPKKGVILITKKDRKLCANPEVKQIEDIMEKVDGLWDPQTTTRSG